MNKTTPQPDFFPTRRQALCALSALALPFVVQPLRAAAADATAREPGRHRNIVFILTGLYAHHHGVVDNNNPVRPDLVFFPQILQRAGYATGFFGKWHMGGEGADPQHGFDRWVSFRGQGEYWPDRRGTAAAGKGEPNTLNVDGRVVPQNLIIFDPAYAHVTETMRQKLFDTLQSTGGMFIPLQPDRGLSANLRREGGSPPAAFPAELVRKLAPDKN